MAGSFRRNLIAIAALAALTACGAKGVER